MNRLSRPLLVFLTVLCLAASALSAQGAGNSAGGQPRAVNISGYGVIERGQGLSGYGRWQGFPISVSLREAPLPEVLRSFARIVGFNLVLAPNVQGSVTVELEDVPWDLALYVILKTHGLGAEIDGRLWLVAPE